MFIITFKKIVSSHCAVISARTLDLSLHKNLLARGPVSQSSIIIRISPSTGYNAYLLNFCYVAFFSVSGSTPTHTCVYLCTVFQLCACFYAYLCLQEGKTICHRSLYSQSRRLRLVFYIGVRREIYLVAQSSFVLYYVCLIVNIINCYNIFNC